MKKATSPLQSLYWVERGLSEQQSKEKVSSIQRERSPRCVEYWIKKGHSRINAKKQVSLHQKQICNKVSYNNRRFWTSEEAKQYSNNFSLKFYTEKYGDKDGIIRYKKRREDNAYYNSLEYFIIKHGKEKGIEIYTRKWRHNNYYSKMSNDIFDEISSNFSDFTCYYGKNEYGKYLDGKYYFYDFIIHNLKLCIEYNGTYWHMDSDIYHASDIHPTSGKTALELWNKDKVKIQAIENIGFDVLVLKESNSKNYNIQEGITFIKDKIESNNIKKRRN